MILDNKVNKCNGCGNLFADMSGYCMICQKHNDLIERLSVIKWIQQGGLDEDDRKAIDKAIYAIEALNEIKKNLDDGRVMSHGWLTELIRKRG